MMEWLQHFLSHDASPLMQFIKYAIVGGLSTGVHILTFYFFAWCIFPALQANDHLVWLLRKFLPFLPPPGHHRVELAPGEEDRLRARNAVICNIFAFFASNVFCYILNRLFVFKPSDRYWLVEFILFCGVSAISIGLGSVMMQQLIRRFRMQTTYAFGANMVCSLLVNYALRKFFVFSG